VNVGIIGVTGNAGAELARLLLSHPQFRLTEVSGRSEAGKKLAAVFPYLHQYDLTIQSEIGEADLFFSALPHKSSAEVCAPLVKQGRRVVDLSADFRLRDVAVYEQTYEVRHPHPDLLGTAVYGLPELRQAEIANTRLVGNPGCYPTASILALAPAVCAGIAGERIIIDAKSGVSGAGRTPSPITNYIEINENTHAYAVDGHRHEPEICQELDAIRPAGSGRMQLTFIPHLVPMTRGILASCYTPMVKPIGKQQLLDLYREFYAGKPFVQIVERPPETKWTYGNNMVYLMPHVHERSGNLLLMAVEDNLGKGAASQAIQNANIMCGLPEDTGLALGAVYP